MKNCHSKAGGTQGYFYLWKRSWNTVLPPSPTPVLFVFFFFMFILRLNKRWLNQRCLTWALERKAGASFIVAPEGEFLVKKIGFGREFGGSLVWGWLQSYRYLPPNSLPTHKFFWLKIHPLVNIEHLNAQSWPSLRWGQYNKILHIIVM